MKKIFLFIVLLIPLKLVAQIITLIPTLPSVDDSVTVIFDATQGNGALANFTGDVYMYTGVITEESVDNYDWKHVVSNWGSTDEKLKLTRIADNKYQTRIHIKSFYNIQPNEVVTKLAFLFYNSGTTIVARDVGNTDILVSISNTNVTSSNKYLSHILRNDTLFIKTSRGTLTFLFYDKTIVKAAFYRDSSIIKADSSMVVYMSPNQVAVSLIDNTDFLEFSSSSLKINITILPFQIKYIFNGDTILSEEDGFRQSMNGSAIRFKLHQNEHIYGTGSRAIPVDRRGKKLTSYNQANYGFSNNTPTLNINIPFQISNYKYGLYFDNPTPGVFDIGSTNQTVFQYSVESGNLAYFFIAGETNGEILNLYTTLTGKPTLPPLWSLGYIQSKYGYANETEARNIVNAIKSANFPIDALVLDLYWFGKESTMGNLSWDYTKWPNPVKMMSDFKNLGVKTILITEPYFTKSSSNYSYLNTNQLVATDGAGIPFVLNGFWAGDATLLDMTNPLATDWMWTFYKSRINEGAAGWWCDLGEPESHPSAMVHKAGAARNVHNTYSLRWAQFLSDRYKSEFPKQRLFNLIRSGYAGMQRFSTFPWSGDVQRSFEGLQAQIPIMLGMAMSGVAYMHSDLGGFTGGVTNPELYTRWIQFGTFCPVMRAHGSGGVPSEPIYYAEPYKSILRNFIQLRYRLLPYNYTLAYQNSLTGKPLAIPMNFDAMDNKLLANINDEYLWGDNMLIAPILLQDQTSRNVLFPAGNWYDYWTNNIYSGNTSQNVNTSINNIPVFAREGSIIPHSPVRYSTDKYNSDTLIIYCYSFSKDTFGIANYTLFNDDGLTPGSIESNQYELLNMSFQNSLNRFIFSIGKSTANYPSKPSTREFILKIIGFQKPGSVTIDQSTASKVDDYNIMYLNPKTFHYSSDLITYVHFIYAGDSTIVEIEASSTLLNENLNQTNLAFNLNPVYPNPAVGSIAIAFDIYKPGNYTINITNVLGQIIQTYSISTDIFGQGTINWNGADSQGKSVNPGVYLIKMSDRDQFQVQKLILSK